jgi:preprotein translocase subunit SecD
MSLGPYASFIVTSYALVAAVVLMQYGSGPVRGFAVTLTIGLVASLFTSIVVTRAIMEYLTRHDTARLSV